MIFGHLWETAETRELLGDEGRTRTWLSVLGTLAAVQGEMGLIPAAAAEEIAARAREPVDLEAVGEETRRSGHSTLGLIRVLQRDLGDEAREWVSFGATVQDVADTWTGLVTQRMLAIAERDLAAIESRRSWPWPAATATPSCSAARTASRGCRSRSASRRRCGWRRCAATASGSRRRGRGSRSGSSPARWGRCRRGASPAPSSSAACSSGSASECPRSRGPRPATAWPSWPACSRS